MYEYQALLKHYGHIKLHECPVTNPQIYENDENKQC